MLLFRLYEKVTKRDVFSVTFCDVQKVNKNTPRVATLWTPGVRFKALHGHAFIEIEVVRVSNSFHALNRCETHALLRKDLWVFIKRRSLIWVDSRLRGIKRESSVGGGFYGNRLQLFGKERVWREKCKKFQFLHTIIFWINLKVCISSHHFLCHAKP